MRWAFQKIRDRSDALRQIEIASFTIIAIIAAQAFLAAVLFFAAPEFLNVGPIDLVVTSVLFVLLAIAMFRWSSRIAAAFLLVLTCIANVERLTGTPKMGALGFIFFALSLWAAIRGMQATLVLHGRLAAAPPSSSPASGPKDEHKFYDQEKWEALLKYDDDIAIAADQLRPFGPGWVEELARAYLAINDKRYLSSIVQKLLAEARKRVG